MHDYLLVRITSETDCYAISPLRVAHQVDSYKLVSKKNVQLNTNFEFIIT